MHKTNVSTETSKADRAVEDPNKQCPIHHKPHPLWVPEDNAICFRCCASTVHQAKNCDVVVKCAECDSERYVTALHPGPAPQLPKPYPPLTEHGGEGEATISQDITAKCTEVCGTGFSGKSCSKICLVDVHPTGRPKEIKRMYVILDNQSNRSLAKSEFFEMFGIQGTTSPYTLKTCAGTKEAAGRREYGYNVVSVDGKVSIPLPMLVECNDVPNNREGIPTPEVPLHERHLMSIADKIPPVDPNAEILLLLG